MSDQPSSFYAQLEPSSQFELEYPFVDDIDFTKLHFNGLGELPDKLRQETAKSLAAADDAT